MARVTQLNQVDSRNLALWNDRRPRMAAAAVALSTAVYQETTLSFREAEAARIRIAQINGCILCNNFRVADGLVTLLERLAAGEQANVAHDRGPVPTPDFYDAIAGWQSSDLFSPRERLAIEYADRIAEAPIELPYDDAFWARLNAVYDENEIVDLTYSITTWIATGRFVHVLGIDGACASDPPARTEQAA